MIHMVVNSMSLGTSRILVFPPNSNMVNQKYEENSNNQTCRQKMKHGGEKIQIWRTVMFEIPMENPEFYSLFPQDLKECQVISVYRFE